MLEAVATRAEIPLQRVDIRFIWELGRHARDVLGRYVSRCQERKLIIGLLEPFLDEDLLTNDASSE